MRPLIILILGTVLLAACSNAGPPSSSPTAGVPNSPAAAPAADCTADDWAAGSQDQAMTLADTRILYQFTTGGPRDGSAGGWSDSVPGPSVRFDASEEHQTIEARAGVVVRLVPAPTIGLGDGRLELYELDAEDRAGDGQPVATVDLGGDASGLDVPLPNEVGRWLLSLSSAWQSDCASGGGFVDLLLITT